MRPFDFKSRIVAYSWNWAIAVTLRSVLIGVLVGYCTGWLVYWLVSVLHTKLIQEILLKENWTAYYIFEAYFRIKNLWKNYIDCFELNVE